MGLFDKFRSSGPEMTPHIAFTASLIYCMASDGEIDPEEMGQLMAAVGGTGMSKRDIQTLLDQAVKVVRTRPFEQFIEEATPLLTDAQRMCILMNLVDSALSDGQAEAGEQQLFMRFQQAFGIDDNRFRPFFQVLALKNDRTIFLDPNHPHNQPDFRVTIG